MIKIRIVAIGRDKDQWVSDGCAHYNKLLSRFARIEIKAIPSLKNSASLTPGEIKKAEAERLLNEFSRGSMVALTDKGKAMDSLVFAGWLDKQQTISDGSITFFIGGPYGLDDSVIAKCNDAISLSPLTFSHQLVRLVLFEQLYRAFTIIHHTDYHK